MRVNISVHGRWHAFELANGLAHRGVMGCIATTYPKVVARRFLAPEIEIRSKPSLEIRRRLWDRWRIGPKPDLAIARTFARFAAGAVASDADLLVGWSAGLLEAIDPAHQRGLKVVVERGSTHIRNQVRVLTDAYGEFGLDYGDTDPEIVARELAEYDAADKIAVPTDYARETFIAEGIDPAKIVVNPYGVDLARFAPPAERPLRARPRILFVGRVGIQKGVPWLLDAAKTLGSAIELHLIGPIDNEASAFLEARGGEHVIVRGPLPAAELPAEYAAADLFCLPSLQEGMPLTLLQAMASGLPSVVTMPSGGGLVRDGGQGFMVPVRDGAALAQAIDRLVRSQELRREMGAAARASVRNAHGWQDYADRAIAAYRSLLAGA